MATKILALEKPVLQDEPAPKAGSVEEALSDANSELAEYARTHFGYGKLAYAITSRSQEQTRLQKRRSAFNRLPEALIKSDISVYNQASVEKYKKQKVRQEKMREVFGIQGDFWMLLYTICMATFSVLHYSGVLSVVPAAVLTFLSGTVCFYQLFTLVKRELSSSYHDKGWLALVSVLTFLPISFFPLTHMFNAQWLMIVGTCFGLIGILISSMNIKDQVQSSAMQWRRAYLEYYPDEIPIFALDRARQLHQLYPNVRFAVEFLHKDPFLVAIDGDTRQAFYIAAWDEPKFEAKHG